MWNSDDVRDQNYKDKGNQTYIQFEEDVSNLDDSNELIKSSIQDKKLSNTNFIISNVTGVDEQIQCDSNELKITFQSCKSATSDEKFEDNSTRLSKPEVDKQNDSNELNKYASSPKSSNNDEQFRKISMVVSNTELKDHKQFNPKKLKTTCDSCKHSRSQEKLSNAPKIVSKTGIDKQIQCESNELNKTVSSTKSSKNDGKMKKKSPIGSTTRIDEHKDCRSYNPLTVSKVSELGVDKQIQCDLNELRKSVSSSKCSEKDGNFTKTSTVLINNGIDKQIQCNSYELTKALSEALKQYLHVYKRQSEPLCDDISGKKCILQYCNCVESDAHQSTEFKEKADEHNFAANVRSNENKTETNKICNKHGKCIRTVGIMIRSNEFRNAPLSSTWCTPSLQKSSTEVVSFRLDCRVSSKITQTIEPNFNSDVNQRSWWSTSYFRTCIGPSLDETLFYTVESFPLFKEFARKILPRTCGGNQRNDDEDLDSFDANI